MSFAGKWVELEIIMLVETSQTQKGKYHVFSHMWNLVTEKQTITQARDMNLKGGVSKRRDQTKEQMRQEGYGGVDRIKIHCMPLWKCLNDTHYFVQ
jgi:hypothetical protein